MFEIGAAGSMSGPGTRKRQPKNPVAADEIVSEAIASSKAGGRFRVGGTRPSGSDFERGSETGNLALVEAATTAIEAAGGRVASTAEARRIIA
ncbi:hypothetical protein NGR_c06720 [Sinorhizobium fredii NGR234]|uniref:Uncharacterized protein n=1 Tax=Sinorhizobium fredii (strain NBRC 101917 / NGR234) TaxID=394 RepID=C3MIB7_SINFN|nr:hypothetical protein NGR_c06720 [Sinorhizobium fredii NGR234]